MNTPRAAYLAGVAVMLGAALLLVWGVAAMGVIGAEGDPFDLLYIGVIAVGVVGAFIARFQPNGMARVLLAMALALSVIALTALVVGKHEVPVSSVAEIVELNGFFVALFLVAAWLFRRAAGQQRSAGTLPRR